MEEAGIEIERILTKVRSIRERLEALEQRLNKEEVN